MLPQFFIAGRDFARRVAVVGLPWTTFVVAITIGFARTITIAEAAARTITGVAVIALRAIRITEAATRSIRITELAARFVGIVVGRCRADVTVRIGKALRWALTPFVRVTAFATLEWTAFTVTAFTALEWATFAFTAFTALEWRTWTVTAFTTLERAAFTVTTAGRTFVTTESFDSRAARAVTRCVVAFHPRLGRAISASAIRLRTTKGLATAAAIRFAATTTVGLATT